MIQAISPIMNPYSDPEYLRILQELMRLGIAPTGSKDVDKAKLAEAKAELIEKIKQKETHSQKQELQVQPITPVDTVQDSKRAEMEEQRLGAMNIAELNKIYFNL